MRPNNTSCGIKRNLAF